MKIYAITCYSVEDIEMMKRGEFSPVDFNHSRDWGFYSNLASAYNCVKYNFTDIYENGYYNIVCIEERTEGVASISQSHYWFEVIYDEANPGAAPRVEPVSQCFFKKCFSYGFEETLPESITSFLTQYEIKRLLKVHDQIRVEHWDKLKNEKVVVPAVVLAKSEEKLELSIAELEYEKMNQEGSYLGNEFELRILRV